MTMRKIFAIIIAIAVVLGGVSSLSGCFSSEIEEFELTDSEIGGLVCISRQEEFIEDYNFNQYILYDPDTLVMYVLITNTKGITMSVLYNSDGTLKLYNPEK